MKRPKPAPADLIALRSAYGVFQPEPTESFQPVRHGVLRKSYNSGEKKGRWVYSAPVFNPRNELRPKEEIAALVDKRTLAELVAQARNALNQIQIRAHCGLLRGS